MLRKVTDGRGTTSIGTTVRGEYVDRQIFSSVHLVRSFWALLSLANSMQWPIVTRLRLYMGPTFAGPARQPLRLGSLSERIDVGQWISTRRGIFGLSCLPYKNKID
jgi:hypothetical protein